MDVKKFCEESIEHCNDCIEEERLSGNVVKKSHFGGAKTAYQTVISALLEAESTKKSCNKQSAYASQIADHIETACFVNGEYHPPREKSILSWLQQLRTFA